MIMRYSDTILTIRNNSKWNLELLLSEMISDAFMGLLFLLQTWNDILFPGNTFIASCRGAEINSFFQVLQ